jgi:hypothetical protein
MGQGKAQSKRAEADKALAEEIAGAAPKSLHERTRVASRETG